MIVNANPLIQNVIQTKSRIMVSVNMIVKSFLGVKHKYVWNPSICTYESGMCLKSIFDNLTIVCDDVINVMNTVSKNSEEKKWVVVFCTWFY